MLDLAYGGRWVKEYELTQFVYTGLEGQMTLCVIHRIICHGSIFERYYFF